MADPAPVCLLGGADAAARRPRSGHPLAAGGRAARGPAGIADRSRRLVHDPHRALLVTEAGGLNPPQGRARSSLERAATRCTLERSAARITHIWKPTP